MCYLVMPWDNLSRFSIANNHHYGILLCYIISLLPTLINDAVYWIVPVDIWSSIIWLCNEKSSHIANIIYIVIYYYNNVPFSTYIIIIYNKWSTNFLTLPWEPIIIIIIITTIICCTNKDSYHNSTAYLFFTIFNRWQFISIASLCAISVPSSSK